jgi:NTP pyrophosphatase (non-canonical NTP hydrolase)
MSETPADSLEQLRLRLADFAQRRDWEQFHSPKNLAMALIAEAAELVEHFQWLSQDQSRRLEPAALAEVRLELADILIYLIRTADQLNIDLIGAAEDKIQLNELRYPVEKARGSARRAADYE